MNVEVSPTSENFPNMYGSITNIFSHSNPVVLVIITIIMIVFFVMFNYLGVSPYSIVNEGAPTSPGVRVIEIIMWGLFIFLILINGLQYIFKLDIKTAMHDILSKEPKIDIAIKGDKSDLTADDKAIKVKKQAFHVADNKYTYEDAKAVCAAMDSRLATQHEIDEAYRNGAEWCSYGWSEDQLALFPTQESTYYRLQKIKGHEHDCGRPGINGGYISNNKIKFGVNCFGYKPDMSIVSRRHMKDTASFPKSKQDLDFEKKVSKYRRKLNDMKVSSFNGKRWSQI